jgi:hypothetical protein
VNLRVCLKGQVRCVGYYFPIPLIQSVKLKQPLNIRPYYELFFIKEKLGILKIDKVFFEKHSLSYG